jgi:phosphoribosylglycinamide formyltransferase-1
VDAQEQAFSYGVRITGCTVHFVDAGTDTGPIIAQAAMAIREDDTRDSLAHRLLRSEHSLLVRALQWIAEDRVHVEPASSEGRARVRLQGSRRIR